MPPLSATDFPWPFPDAVRAEGERLFREGKVRLLEGSGGNVFEADVAFFRRFHRVWLERKPTGVEAECTCPTRENDGTGCAHLWGLVLAANAREAESGAAPAPPITPVWGVVKGGPPGELRLGIFAPAGDEGAPARLRRIPADADHLARLEDGPDAALLRRIAPLAGGRRSLLDGGGFTDPAGPWKLPPDGRDALLDALAGTGRLRLVLPGAEDSARDLGALVQDRGGPFELVLALEPAPGREGRVRIDGRLRRGAEDVAFAGLAAVAADARPVAVHGGRILDVEAFGAADWLGFLARGKELLVPAADVPGFLAKLAAGGPLPRLRLPGAAAPLPVEAVPPQGRLAIRRRDTELQADLTFAYDRAETAAENPARLLLAPAQDRQRLRSPEAERALAAALDAVPGLERDTGALSRWFVDRAGFDATVAALLEAGFAVTADDRPFRRPGGAPGLRLRSGIEWFELEGDVDFDGGATAPLGEVLAAWRRGARFVPLGDGSRGLLPAEWVARLDRLQRLSGDAEGRLRFRRAQALLLEPWLDTSLRDAADRDLAALREQLRAVGEAGRRSAPRRFQGTLRPYQEHGLAWLRALAAARLGGCLADDMGLGKTVQALALLLELKDDPPEGPPLLPALIVCPRSLLWNWRDEAARFSPGLRVLDHHGPGRATRAEDLAGADVVLTTYGTLQRDEALLAGFATGLVILDEAQAIKNPRSRNAACARALPARARLSLTGTPIENSLRDLWSQMEFLNPGLLGPEDRFLDTLGATDAGPARAVLAKALRPLILRRTKEEVVPELPPKTEQTLLCELSPEQETLYAAIREEARRSLERRLDEEGVERVRFHVLESLLRLRQAACHPALLDPALADAPSGKLDLLLDEVAEVVASGHKALVFSQFVAFLRLAATRLDREGLAYAWLDGTTRDREAVVRRFQTDPGCPVFLISLKAGGLGLNLTAADYVFLLDPWWNPAVEAQAIDRTHRIGQTRPVFAYRLVARGTVEERILDLQDRKRDLADAILAADAGPMASLTEEDLRLLLS